MIRDLAIACAGALLFGHLVIALFFWRFWRRTGAPLFAHFAVAFLILAIERALILTAVADRSHQPLVYFTRLVAFLVIIWGVWATNRRRS